MKMNAPIKLEMKVYAVNKDALDCEIPHSLGRKCPLEETSKCQCRIAVLH